jgi:hypothetical protein
VITPITLLRDLDRMRQPSLAPPRAAVKPLPVTIQRTAVCVLQTGTALAQN